MDEQRKPQHIVIGQQILEEKQTRARQMRQAMTPAEARLWERLRGSKLGVNFRRQQVIDGFIADFYCHAAALVVEVDGPIHDPDYDAERDAILSQHGLTTLRFTNHEVEHQLGRVLYAIRQHLQTSTNPRPVTPTSEISHALPVLPLREDPCEGRNDRSKEVGSESAWNKPLRKTVLIIDVRV